MEISWPVQIIVALLFGSLSSYLAFKKKRNPWIWGGIGFLFGIFGFFLLLFLPKVKTEEFNAAEELQPQKEDIIIQPTPTDEEILPDQWNEKEWYFLNDEQKQEGPFSFEELRTSWKKELLHARSYIWTLGLSNWHRIDEFIDFKNELNS